MRLCTGTVKTGTKGERVNRRTHRIPESWKEKNWLGAERRHVLPQLHKRWVARKKKMGTM